MTRIVRENVTVPVIVQAVGGDLRVRGRSAEDLIVDGDALHVEQIGDGQPYLIRCGGDCRITVPQNVDVSVQNVGGDAKLTDLGGAVDINNISGSLTLRSVHGVQIKNVSGDLRIKWAEGDVMVKTVGADATIREVTGSVMVKTVGADLYLRNVEGDCVAEEVGSDLVLSIDFVPGQDYRFKAGNDVLCRVQPETNARFILPLETTVAAEVDAEIVETEDGEQIVTVGDGSAIINIEAGDEVRLFIEAEDYVFDLGTQIEEELEARLSNLEEKLSQQLEGLDERIQAKTEFFASQAERMAERAQKQAERAAEKLRRVAERQKPKRKREMGTPSFVEFAWGGPPHPPSPPGAPQAKRRPSDPVTEQERLMILRMVQENKISVEDAERLLAALDTDTQD